MQIMRTYPKKSQAIPSFSENLPPRWREVGMAWDKVRMPSQLHPKWGKSSKVALTYCVSHPEELKTTEMVSLRS